MANKEQNRGSSRSRGPSLNLLGSSADSRKRSSLISAGSDLKKLSGSDRVVAAPIAFGKPSEPTDSRKAVNSGVNWQTLLTKASSSGGSRLLRDGLLGFGVNELFSSLTSFFGSGKPTVQPLTRFSLPDAQNATVYLGGGSLTSTAIESAASSPSRSGVYSPRVTQADQSTIVKAVRNALLTSSSLNDVIGDL